MVPVGPSQIQTCHVGSRPVPGGIRLSLEKARTQESRGGPPPPHFMTRSLALARFGGCGALFRLWGYYGAHLRTLIWNAFSCRAARPRGLPMGKLSPKVTDEGATDLPNGTEEKFR